MDNRLKVCSSCKEHKQPEEYYKEKKAKDGLSYSCICCKKEQTAKYKQTDKYKEKVRRNLWKRQGIDITYEQYLKLFLEQEGACAICGSAVNQFNKGMCVDHNHTTGKVRGLLCTDCNRGIGSLKDDKELLQKALDYLNKYE